MTTSKLAIELWEVENLIPYAKNAKIHSDEQVDRLVRAITKFGFTSPIVVDKDGVIIAGHGRRLACIKLGLKRVPVICRRDLTPEEVQAARIADNMSASKEYDSALMRDEILELQDLDFDLSTLAMNENELSFLATDHDMPDESAFIDDITGAVEEQKAKNAERVEEIDESTAPLGDALGFKRVTIAQSRVIRDFMVKVEITTGKKGAEALAEFAGRF